MTRRSLLASGAAAFVGRALPGRTLPDKVGAEPAAFGAVPTARQLAWHQLEFYGFLHFTVNTFTDREWGEGDEDPSVFNPANFDPDSILDNLKAAGMRGVILTCKHHDGFCLWPTKTTDHSIRKSSWRGGTGDVVRDISQAAARHGLKFGVYLSPWDRHNALYGRPEYIQMYRQQLTELLTNYGPIFEIWHDGANGGTGYYGGAKEKRTIDKHSYYDWPNTWALARSLQPDAVIFSDAGPDIRWVGNEKGIAGDPCWETFTPVGENGGPGFPGDVKEAESNSGTRNGKFWMPPECDVSIRPGWFWHEAENGQVKTPRQLMDLFYQSAGRGGSLLLNVPPTREGILGATDTASLREFGRMLRSTFGRNLAVGGEGPRHLLDGDRSSYWAAKDGSTEAFSLFEFQSPVTFHVIGIREAIQFGQRIGGVEVQSWNGGAWTTIAKATSIGSWRLLKLAAPISATKLRLLITEAAAPPVLSEFALFSDPGA